MKGCIWAKLQLKVRNHIFFEKNSSWKKEEDWQNGLNLQHFRYTREASRWERYGGSEPDTVPQREKCSPVHTCNLWHVVFLKALSRDVAWLSLGRFQGTMVLIKLTARSGFSLSGDWCVGEREILKDSLRLLWSGRRKDPLKHSKVDSQSSDGRNVSY